MTPSEEYRATLRASLPKQFLSGIVPWILGSYQVAQEATAHFPDGVLHDLLPQYRHAVVQAGLLMLAKKYEGHGVMGSSEKNLGENSYYTLIRAGQIVLTESPVPTQNAVVRQAIFRTSYATSNQPDLFLQDKRPAPDALLYALVVHGPGGLVARPSFAKIVFPLPDLSGYVDSGIDLIHDHLSAADANRGGVEEIADRIRLELKEGVRRNQELPG